MLAVLVRLSASRARTAATKHLRPRRLVVPDCFRVVRGLLDHDNRKRKSARQEFGVSTTTCDTIRFMSGYRHKYQKHRWTWQALKTQNQVFLGEFNYCLNLAQPLYSLLTKGLLNLTTRHTNFIPLDPSLEGPSEPGCRGGHPSPPDFWGSVNLALIRGKGADYAYCITARPPDFQTFLRSCLV